MPVDFTPFEEHDRQVVERYGGSRARAAQKQSEWWPDRVKLIHEQFPSTAGGQAFWESVLDDTDILGKILKDVLAVDMADPRKEGRRFEPTREEAEQRLRQLRGLDYAHEPFVVVFRVLTTGQSRTQVARKTGLSRSRVHRLLAGEEKPDRPDLEAIAKGYGKHPSYFKEYRTDEIVRVVLHGLEEMPEYSADVYRKMTR